MESVYQRVLAYELEKKGFRIREQVSIPIAYEDIHIPDAFRAEIIVEDLVILELKSSEMSVPVYSKQLLTYLRLTGMKLGYLLNFGCETMKGGLERIINGNLES